MSAVPHANLGCSVILGMVYGDAISSIWPISYKCSQTVLTLYGAVRACNWLT
jgi:hypothetical protein